MSKELDIVKECCDIWNNLKSKNKMIDYLIESKKQILDLEAKLAESEKKFNVANNLRKNSDEVLLNYKTEKYGLDKTIQELRKMKLSLPEKEWYYKGFENCERQMSSHIADLTLEVKKLKQQLAESDAEIEKVEKTYMKQRDYYTKEFNEVIDNLKQKLAEKEKENDLLKLQAKEYLEKGMLIVRQQDLLAIDEKHNQDKISFAVEQLEKVKEFTDKAWWVDGVSECVIDYINDQIKQLKGEK